MFEYCKICPCNENGICIFGEEEDPVEDIEDCVYPEWYDKEWYANYQKNAGDGKL